MKKWIKRIRELNAIREQNTAKIERVNNISELKIPNTNINSSLKV
jgi:hypothetical protein